MDTLRVTKDQVTVKQLLPAILIWRNNLWGKSEWAGWVHLNPCNYEWDGLKFIAIQVLRKYSV